MTNNNNEQQQEDLLFPWETKGDFCKPGKLYKVKKEKSTELWHLNKSFATWRSILHIKEGEIFMFVGPSKYIPDYYHEILIIDKLYDIDKDFLVPYNIVEISSQQEEQEESSNNK